MTVPRFYYYVNVILKNDPKLFQDFKIWFLKINTFLKFDEGVLDTENQLVRM